MVQCSILLWVRDLTASGLPTSIVQRVNRKWHILVKTNYHLINCRVQITIYFQSRCPVCFDLFFEKNPINSVSCYPIFELPAILYLWNMTACHLPVCLATDSVVWMWLLWLTIRKFWRGRWKPPLTHHIVPIVHNSPFPRNKTERWEEWNINTATSINTMDQQFVP